MRNRCFILIISNILIFTALIIPAAFPQTKPAAEADDVRDKNDTIKRNSRNMELNGYNSPTGNPFWNSGETKFKAGLRYSILIGTPAIIFLYGIMTWDWGSDHNFRMGHENWFGSDTDSGGADKAGHAFSHYVITRIAFSFFSYTEKTRNTAVLLSGLTGALVGALIEIGDGFTGRYGFSTGDLICDSAGIAIAMISDKFPAFDAFVGFTATYIPSKAFRENHDSYLNFSGDYSGWKFMFNFKLAGFRYLGLYMPEFLRYFQFDIGYYTRNYTDYDNEAGKFNGKRYMFYGISVNMRERAGDFFPSNAKAKWLAEQPFKYYHVPIGYENSSQIGKSHEESSEE